MNFVRTNKPTKEPEILQNQMLCAKGTCISASDTAKLSSPGCKNKRTTTAIG
jgi:hypothetical protein